MFAAGEKQNRTYLLDARMHYLVLREKIKCWLCFTVYANINQAQGSGKVTVQLFKLLQLCSKGWKK